DRMQKSGRMEEAFRALNEFADLCPDQDDIRLMLADQLSKLDRKAEAIEQLQLLYARYDSEGRNAEASATAERMKAIDPTVEPRSGHGAMQSSSQDLIFIDLDDSPRKSTRVSAVVDVPEPVAPPAPPPRPVTPPRVATPLETEIVSGARASDAIVIEKPVGDALLGLESTTLADE